MACSNTSVDQREMVAPDELPRIRIGTGSARDPREATNERAVASLTGTFKLTAQIVASPPTTSTAVVMANVRPGDLLFPEALWAGVAAPLRSRAAASGALLLVGDRKLAIDFAERVPIVGELLSR